MWNRHWIRVGVLGSLGRFEGVDATPFARGQRVVVRTSRGLEVGQVLAPDAGDSAAPSAGQVLRRMTVADELLAARLEAHRHRALEDCTALLSRYELGAVLVDAELLFDGGTLAFYFWGEPPVEIEGRLEQLSFAYQAQVQLARFADTLEHGCGPDCGTEHALGHGCSACATGCAVAEACRPRGAVH